MNPSLVMAAATDDLSVWRTLEGGIIRVLFGYRGNDSATDILSGIDNMPFKVANVQESPVDRDGWRHVAVIFYVGTPATVVDGLRPLGQVSRPSDLPDVTEDLQTVLSNFPSAYITDITMQFSAEKPSGPA